MKLEFLQSISSGLVFGVCLGFVTVAISSHHKKPLIHEQQIKQVYPISSLDEQQNIPGSEHCAAAVYSDGTYDFMIGNDNIFISLHFIGDSSPKFFPKSRGLLCVSVPLNNQNDQDNTYYFKSFLIFNKTVAAPQVSK